MYTSTSFGSYIPESGIQISLACLDVIKGMEALTTAGWGGSRGGSSRRSSWCQRKEEEGEGGGGLN